MKIDLTEITRRIKQREEAIALLKERTLTSANEAMAEYLLQGQDLARVKTSLPHGQWSHWLEQSGINERSARDYMRLAAHPELIKAGSIRKAIALLDDTQDKEHGEPRRWPPFIEALGRLSKLAGYIERFPIDRWPAESAEKFRSELLPIAQRLWPDKFL